MELNAVGWDRLVAEVLGTGTGPRSDLFTILSRPVGAERPWSTQRLDLLWDTAHAAGSGRRSGRRAGPDTSVGAPSGTRG